MTGGISGSRASIEPQERLDASGFDPGRMLDVVAKAIYDATDPLSGDAIATTIHLSEHLFWDGMAGATDCEKSLAAVRVVCRAAAIAAVTALHELGRSGPFGWCPVAARKAEVEISRALWALGQKARPLQDDEIFRACLAEVLASAIEARSGETAQTGSTEGKSAVPKGDAR